ncbi:MAG: Gfo/Idh/MocA family oxidoreductase [Bacteroidales bacterium]|jgi:UDP-N-acetyl-2-amino-2-deoxyglucuronate dehydrogenase|nr:Gfo/Idh/MocA family oxidoreductase [Bacteroidales bacterium]
MKNFAIMGVGGYIAPRHLKAIKETGNQMIAAYDISDSVGIIDNFFPEADFFTQMELFDRHCSKLRNSSTPIDYLTICTPNYLHDAHIRYGLRLGATVICEKPLVLNPWNLDTLQQMETENNKKVNAILQMRLHDSARALKEKIRRDNKNKVYEVDLRYITARGKWFYAGWKGDDLKSGGIATNIGIHFYDLLGWLFGHVTENIVHVRSHDRVAGFLGFEKARVRYFLSINEKHLPQEAIETGNRVFRSFIVDGEEYNLSHGFTELHSQSYKEILEGHGFGIEDVRDSVQMVYHIKTAPVLGLIGDYHPLAKFPLAPHPFKPVK